jgi:lipoate-protein ligase A
LVIDDVCRVIVDAPASGAWNMAVDAALLETAVDEKQCFLRWYRWEEPTLSLGYFQKSPESLGAADKLPRVKRLSGGGAIVHDDELTYSCALPAGHPLAREPLKLYSIIHQRIAELLQSDGFPVKERGTSLADRASEFLCFGRGDTMDLVIGDVKVLGSAQRRRKGAVLQHGSLILRRSRFAPDFPGLFDLCPEVPCPPPDSWLDRLGNALGKVICDSIEFTSIPENVLRRIHMKQ